MLPPTPALSLPLLLLLAVVAVARAGDEKPLPDYLHVCKRNDPEVEKCLKDTLSYLKPYMAKGMPELNAPPLEPLYLRELVLSEIPNLRVVANDIEAYEASKFDIKDIKLDYENGLFSFHLSFPKMKIVGKYSVDGRVLLLPVKGSGPVRVNISNVESDVNVKTEMVERDGAEYVSLKSLKMRITIGDGSVQLENLFGGDRVLGEVVNAAVNANFGQVLAELKPSIERALDETLGDLAGQILTSYPADQLFPAE